MKIEKSHFVFENYLSKKSENKQIYLCQLKNHFFTPFVCDGFLNNDIPNIYAECYKSYLHNFKWKMALYS